MNKTRKLNRLSEIVELVNEKGLSLNDVGRIFGKSEATMWRYARILRENGYTLNTTKGRKTPPLA